MPIIIIEGPDFSGKTTLVNRLQKDLNLFSIKSSLPNSLHDVLNSASRTVAMSRGIPGVICDRISLISEVIYSPICRQRESCISINASLEILADINPIIIYCNPGIDHLMKITGEQLEGVKENITRLDDAYEEFMHNARMRGLEVHQFNFLHHGETQRITNLIRDELEAVNPGDKEIVSIHEFHEKFGVAMPQLPSIITGEMREFREKFLKEELAEFLEALDNKDIVTAFDSLIDLDYVLKGTALLMGISPVQWTNGFQAVHDANMKKVRASSAADSKRGTQLDVVKPEGWQKPEPILAKILGL